MKKEIISKQIYNTKLYEWNFVFPWHKRSIKCLCRVFHLSIALLLFLCYELAIFRLSIEVKL